MGEAEPFTEVDVFPQVPSAEDVEEFWPKPEEEQKPEESKPSPGPGSESGQTPEPEQEKPEGGNEIIQGFPQASILLALTALTLWLRLRHENYALALV